MSFLFAKILKQPFIDSISKYGLKAHGTHTRDHHIDHIGHDQVISTFEFVIY